VRLLAAAVALAALALAGCDESTSSAGLACTARAGDHRVGDALVHVPPRGATDRFATLVVAHPAGTDGPAFARLLRAGRAADRAHVLLLFPSSRRQGFWQLNDRAGTTDLDTVRALLDEATRRFCADPAKVAVAGVSNGGGFSARVACELSDRVDALVSLAGSYRALDPCRATRPVSVLEIHGTADRIVPYATSAPAFVAAWARRDGCDPHPARATPRPGVTLLTWHGCRAGSVVEHLRLAGTGHGWPRVHMAQGRDPTGTDVTAELFRFLASRGIGAAG